MTKEQYEAAVITLQAKYKCDSDYYQGLVDVNSEYIASLEAEVAKLNMALDVACKMLEYYTGSCPHDLQEYQCSACEAECVEPEDWWQCWKEYLLSKAKEQK